MFVLSTFHNSPPGVSSTSIQHKLQYNFDTNLHEKSIETLEEKKKHIETWNKTIEKKFPTICQLIHNEISTFTS